MGLGGVLLFALLFLWQVPHFAAIAIFRAQDYARAGLQVVSVQKGERAARRTIALWTVLLVGASLLFYPFGLAGRTYLAVATALGVGFLALAFRGIRGGKFDVRAVGPSRLRVLHPVPLHPARRAAARPYELGP